AVPGGLERRLDFWVVGIGFKERLLAPNAAVTQADPVPVVEPLAPQRQCQRKKNPLIPDRRILGRKAAGGNRDAQVAPWFKAVDTYDIMPTLFQQDSGRCAEVADVEIPNGPRIHGMRPARRK